MRRWQPSLVRQLTLGFIVANGIAVLLFLVSILYFAALIEEDERPGPDIAIALLRSDLVLDIQGRPALREGARFPGFTERHPQTWFVARSEGGELRFGTVPPRILEDLQDLPASAVQVRYRNWGTEGHLGDAFTDEWEEEGQAISVTTGGVESDQIGFGDFLLYMWNEDFFWIPVFTAFFNLAGAAIAIPIVLRSVRSTARAAAELDPSDLSKRLPEKGVVKELRPIVHAFNAALNRLAEDFDRRRRFIADVAHELRTPLAVLNLHAENLPEVDSKRHLQRTLYRLSQMVGQMLDAERLALSGKRHIKVDLVEIAKAALAETAPVAFANGYELSFRSETPTVIKRGDPHSISRAVTNLVGNAIAHGGGSGTIEVRVSRRGVIEVCDEGPGIPVEARERIFEPFHRERWDKDGCGLGLHLVKEIMLAHGGDAKVVNSATGSVFRLEFPPAGRSVQQ